MRTVVIPIIILFAPALAVSNTLYVPKDYPKIQDAIDNAVNGDHIEVSPGTYIEIIDFKGKAIIVQSSDGPGATVIDGFQSGQNVVTFKTGETPQTVLDGFTITNGGSKLGGSYGGIYCDKSSPTITRNIITGNGTGYSQGAGIYCYTSSPVITHNTIIGNEGNHGGGIYGSYSSAAVIEDNIISGNTAKGNGGGIVNVHSNLTIRGNTLSGNSAKLGGGVHSSGTSVVTIQGNTFSGNTADEGGGIFVSSNQSSNITLNTIIQNTALLEGGGIKVFGGSPVVSNNIIADNMAAEGGGILGRYSSMMIQGNTVTGNIAGNAGGGLYFIGTNSKSEVMNTICWNNSAPSGPGIWIGKTGEPATVTISHSDVEGGQGWVHVDPGCTLNWGAGMIDADPFFVDPSGGDYHLEGVSPCIDAGDNLAPSLLAMDIDGDPRIVQGLAPGCGRMLCPVGSPPPEAKVDMGADEYCVIKKKGTLRK